MNTPPPTPWSCAWGRDIHRKASSNDLQVDPPSSISKALQGAAVNRTLVLLGVATILDAIITQPSAFGHC